MMIKSFKSVNKILDASQLEASLDAVGQSKTLTNDSIAMLFGIVIGVLLLLLFFVYLTYYFPWWETFLTLIPLFNCKCLNCVYCYFYCCKGLELSAARQLRKRRCKEAVFVQDMIAAPDGNIIHASDIRPMCSIQQQQPKSDLYTCHEV